MIRSSRAEKMNVNKTCSNYESSSSVDQILDKLSIFFCKLHWCSPTITPPVDKLLTSTQITTQIHWKPNIKYYLILNHTDEAKNWKTQMINVKLIFSFFLTFFFSLLKLMHSIFRINSLILVKILWFTKGCNIFLILWI